MNRLPHTGDVVRVRPQGTLRSERVTYSVKTGRLAAGVAAGFILATVADPQTLQRALGAP